MLLRFCERPCPMSQPFRKTITPALDQRPKEVRGLSNFHLVSLAFFVKLAPMVLLIACVACKCSHACEKAISPQQPLIRHDWFLEVTERAGHSRHHGCGTPRPKGSPRVRCDNVPEASGAIPIVVERMAVRVSR